MLRRIGKLSWFQQTHENNATVKDGGGLFAILPDEMLLLVFSYLDLKSLASVSLVDKRTHYISSEDVLWQCLYKREIEDLIPTFWIGRLGEKDDEDVSYREHLKRLIAHTYPSNSAAKDQNGKKKGRTKKKERGLSHLYDKKRKEWPKTKRLGAHMAKVYAVDVAKDGQLMASVGQDGKVKVWDTSSIKDTQPYTAINLRSAWPMTCALSPSSEMVATGGLDSMVILHRVVKSPKGKSFNENEQTVKELVGHTGYVACVEWVDERYVLSSGGDNEVRLWDIESGSHNIVGRAKMDVMCVRVSPLNPFLICTASCDALIRLHDTRIPQQPAVGWGKKGTKLNGNMVLKLKGHKADVNCVTFSPNGLVVAGAGDDGQVTLFDIRRANHAIMSYSPSTDNNNNNNNNGNSNSNNKKKERVGVLHSYGHNEESGVVMSVCFSPDGRMLFAGGELGILRRFDTLTNDTYPMPPLHDGRITCLSLSPDGHFFATSSWDHCIILWPL